MKKKIAVLLPLLMCVIFASGCFGAATNTSSEQSAVLNIADIADADHIVLPDYTSVEAEDVIISDTEAETGMRVILGKFENVKTQPAVSISSGDLVTLNYKLSFSSVAESVKCVIGSGELISGLEEKLIGMKAGDKKDITITLANDFFNKTLRGKDATVSVEIVSAATPLIDENNIKAVLGNDVTLEAFKQAVKTEMRFEKLSANVMTKFVNACRVKKDEASLLDKYITEKKRFDKSYAESLNTKPEELCGMSADEYNEYVKEYADKKYARELVYARVIKKESIVLTAEEKEAGTLSLARREGKTAEQFKEEYEKEFIDSVLLKEKAARFIIENIKIK